MTFFDRVTRSLTALVLAALVALAGLPAPGAFGAQSGGTVTLELLRQPVWHDPGDDFNLKVRITNETDEALDGYGIVVGIYYRVLNRSELHSRFDLTEFEAPGSFPIEYGDSLEPGESAVETITNPLSESPVLGTATDNGVYPLKLSVVDSFGTPLGGVSTQLLYYPTPPDPPNLAMNATFVLPVSDFPARAPSGVFTPAEDGTYPLETAIAEGGWLFETFATLRAELERAATREPAGRGGKQRILPNLRLAIVPGARLVEELDDMATGYLKEVDGEVERIEEDDPNAQAARDMLDVMKEVLSSPSVQAVAAPYSFADLPSLAPYPLEIANQLAEADAIYKSVLDVPFDRDWIYAPGGRLDSDSLEELWLGSSPGHTFLEPDSLVPPENIDLSGCPSPQLSATCPVEVPVGTEFLTGYALDQGVQERITEMTRVAATRSDMQRLFAETSMIREEEPSLGHRTIQIIVPAGWDPTPGTFRTFIGGLAKAPWLEMMTPNEGLAAADDLAPREIVAEASHHPKQPEPEYFEEVLAAQQAVGSFATIDPPLGALTRLRRNVLEAFGSVWWGDRASTGREYATSSVEEIRGELDKIGVDGADTTLSSRKGSIQLVVHNDTEYEVNIGIELTGSILVDDSELELAVPSGQQTVTIDVTALTSGIFGLDVQLVTPDGGLAITEPKTIVIRSTEYNQIAVAITFGALAFLVLFYMVRGIRRRRDAHDSTGETSTT